MAVTRRFCVLMALGVPLLLAAALLHETVPVMLFWLYNGALLALLALDFVLTPQAGALVVTREPQDKLSHRAPNALGFTVRNPTGHRLRIWARDAIPSRHFSNRNVILSQKIPPGQQRLFSYETVPSKRGAFVFSHVHIKVRGLLGLGAKYFSHACPTEFKVYPNLQDLSRFRLMIQNNRLLPTGEKTLKNFGTGTEFESLRPYVEGDDFRKVNWKVTARENRLIVNDYQVEKNQPVFILIDGGRPMSYSVGGYQKLDYAVNAALVLADIVNQKGDQSGLLVFDTDVRTLIMPGKGDAHRNRLMEALYHIEGTRDTSNYEAAIHMLCRRQKRRALVFIFTDFETTEEAEELTAHVAMLKRRHFPLVVFMKNEGLLALAENAPKQKDRKLAVKIQEVAQEFVQDRNLLFRRLNALSVPNVETEAAQFSTTAVNRYLALRGV